MIIALKKTDEVQKWQVVGLEQRRDCGQDRLTGKVAFDLKGVRESAL